MDEAAIARIYQSCLRHARHLPSPDPAVEPGDLVQMAWLRAHGKLDVTLPEEEQTLYMRRVITNLALDERRTARRRPRGEYGDWLQSGQDVEREAAVWAELGPLLAETSRGATLAVGMACGWARAEIAAALGIPDNTAGVVLWRWWQGRRGQEERAGYSGAS